ncbi:ferredoxin [Nocardia arizonensis]|uniref:ferredoxin n=1 Tax=Nocardia arizonensis TaxID=1141647 RepID=UPI0006CF2D06|nr:ferredoxin [Nocardia arizonensis]
MKVVVDLNKCSAHGRCFAVASEFYDVDDDGYNAMNGVEVPEELHHLAIEGAEACPEQAITIIE